MNNPLVSVIIPVYRVERFLSACVDSVLAQTYPNLEIILVDDGSPDNCPAICDSYAERDARVRVIHQQNGGLSRARNAGLAAAQGRYVYFLDSDDYLIPEAIETLTAHAEEDETDLLFFEAILVSEDGSEHPEQNAHRRKYRYDIPRQGAEVLCELVQNNEFMTPVPYLFLRRNFMEGRCFEPDLIYEDVLFSFLAFLDAKRVKGLNAPLYRYRIRGGSIMTGGASIKHFSSLLKIYRAIEVRLTDADENARRAILQELATLQQAELHLYYRMKRSDRSTVRQDHKAFLRSVAESGYAKTDPALFSARPMRVLCTQMIHRVLAPETRKKIKRFLHR